MMVARCCSVWFFCCVMLLIGTFLFLGFVIADRCLSVRVVSYCFLLLLTVLLLIIVPYGCIRVAYCCLLLLMVAHCCLCLFIVACCCVVWLMVEDCCVLLTMVAYRCVLLLGRCL